METLNLKNQNDKLLHKLIIYEDEIFNKFIQSRTNLIKSLKEIDTTTLNKFQLKNMTYDLKHVLDTLKNTTENISEFILNQKNDFKNNNSVNFNNFITHYFLFKDLLYRSENPVQSEEESDESSERDSEPLSLSVSLSLSSDSLE
jgi:hypothetical protein